MLAIVDCESNLESPEVGRLTSIARGRFGRRRPSATSSLGAGNGSVSGSPTFSGNTMTVNLTGVTDVQTLTVTLSDVTDEFGEVLPSAAIPMGVLFGDVNGSRVVTTSDTNLTKAQALQPLTGANSRRDVNTTGSINTADTNLVKGQALSRLP